jgi:hypothetical protein
MVTSHHRLSLLARDGCKLQSLAAAGTEWQGGSRAEVLSMGVVSRADRWRCTGPNRSSWSQSMAGRRSRQR